MRRDLTRRGLLGAGAGAFLTGCASTADSTGGPAFADRTIATPDGRLVRLRAARPARRPRGFVAFSHGANSDNAKYDAVLRPWAQAGFLVVAPTHVDSETNPDRARFDQAAVLRTRLEDMRLVIDDRSAWGEVEDAPVAVAGHSFGALIAQALIGAELEPYAGQSFQVPGAIAAVAISPPPALPGYVNREGWAKMAKPCLVTTGTADVMATFAPNWESRLESVEAAPHGVGFAFIVEGVDHYFGGAICRDMPAPDQDRELAATNAVALAFLNAAARGRPIRPDLEVAATRVAGTGIKAELR